MLKLILNINLHILNKASKNNIYKLIMIFTVPISILLYFVIFVLSYIFALIIFCFGMVYCLIIGLTEFIVFNELKRTFDILLPIIKLIEKLTKHN